LGDDANTTTRHIWAAGKSFYCVQGIPAGWLEKLAMRDFIGEMADQLLKLSPPN
jgi:ADP-ribosyl-[dinitrogen reductase] hydrolase